MADFYDALRRSGIGTADDLQELLNALHEADIRSPDELRSALRELDLAVTELRKYRRKFDEPTPVVPAKNTPGIFLCPECGRRKHPKHAFCHHCGKRLR